MTRRLLTLWMAALAVTLLAGCDGENSEPARSPVELALYALDNSCSATAEAAAPERYQVKVVTRLDNRVEVLANRAFNGNPGTLRLDDIPEGTNLEVSILGFSGPDKTVPPVNFARARNITISADETTKIEVPLARYADFSCVAKPGGATNLLFPTATTLPDGRILVAGGFSKVLEETGHFEIAQASNKGYIFDPQKGEIYQAKNEMNKGRGAHTAVYLPKSQLIMLVGGSERLFLDKDTSCFQWYFLKDKAGTVGFTYELFDIASERFLTWETDQWPDEANELATKVRRVFAQASLNNDGTVLVTGGGQWPSCKTKAETDTDYRVAELYRPRSGEDYSGKFMPSYGALTMKAMRAGHSAVLLEVKDKRAVHLLWGGSEDGPIAELYTEASGQVDGTFGVFTPVEFLDDNSYKKRPYFHTITPLRDRRFLLLGGLAIQNSKLAVPKAGDAHLLDVKSNGKVAISAIDGMDIGRYFHTATTFDSENVVLIGGFTSIVQGENVLFAGTASDDIRFFNLTSKKLELPPVDASPLPVAGGISAPLQTGCLLLAGGVDTPAGGLEFGPDKAALRAEVYCPSVVCPEGLWETTCYQE